jgi:hemerythrin superfamily protein
MPRRTKPDAVALIKEDHRKVEGLFESFEKARDEDRKKALAREICTELTIHAMIEEEIFYPACQGKIEDEDVLNLLPGVSGQDRGRGRPGRSLCRA